MQIKYILFLIISIILSSTSFAEKADQLPNNPIRVLFVGNSLTYVNNLPAVFDALAITSGTIVRSDIIAEGGATLTQHLAEGLVQKSLSDVKYDFVVFQERGGDIICSFGPQSCLDAREALSTLTSIAKSRNTKVIFLGTYQFLADVLTELVKVEKATSEELGISYVSISERFRLGLQIVPDADWLDKDGAHPGPDLTLLNAMLLYQEIFKTDPSTATLTIKAVLRRPNGKGTLSNYIYQKERMMKIANLGNK